LVDFHIHLGDENAVSGGAVTLFEQNDVADDEILAEDGLRGAHVTTEHINFVVLDFLLKEQELLLLTPIAEGLDQTSEQDSEGDRGSINPSDIVGEEGEEEAGSTKEQQNLHVELIELVPKDGPERSHRG